MIAGEVTLGHAQHPVGKGGSIPFTRFFLARNWTMANNKPTPKKDTKRGRKPKYESHIKANFELITGYLRAGHTEESIYKAIGINRNSWYEYKKKYPELQETLKKGKEVVDYEVQNSLYKKCVGHYAKEGRAFKCKEKYYDEEGRKCERETVQVVDVDIFIPPDTMAMAIWLNNRMSDRWRRNAGKEKLEKERFEHDKEIDEKRYW